jgi:hypothetical protein
MKFLTSKLFVSFNLIIFLLVFSQFSLSQTKIVGELTLAANSSVNSEIFITVNGERAEKGRSIMSPSVISTPQNINAKISFANVGSITVSPNSELNLSFDSSNMSGSLQSGEFIIYSNPNVAVNFSTPDGNVTVPVSNNLHSFEVKIANGKSTIYSILGETQFNGTSISAGGYFPKQLNDKPSGKSSDSNSGLLIIGILGAVGAGVLLAVSAGSGSNGGSVSPVR